MTPAGLEPAIPGSVGRCLIHWATGPAAMHRDWRHGNMRRLVGGESKATTVLGLPQPSAHGCQVHEKLNSMIRGSIVASISACHAEDPGSIPGRGGACRDCCFKVTQQGSSFRKRKIFAEPRQRRNYLRAPALDWCCVCVRACVCPRNDPGRTRTCNPRLRRPMPYPLGHGANCSASRRLQRECAAALRCCQRQTSSGTIRGSHVRSMSRPCAPTQTPPAGAVA